MVRTLPPVASLTPQQLAALLEELAAQVRVGIPWSQELNTGGRLRAEALEPLTAGLREGRSVEDVLSEISGTYGPQVAAVVQASAVAADPAEALSGLARLIRRRLDYRRELRAAMAYPVIVSLMAMAILVTGLYWIERHGSLDSSAGNWTPEDWTILGTAAGVLAVVLIVWAAFRFRTGGWLPGRIRALRWARMAWFAELVALELEHGVPRDQAVQLSAQASGDSGLRRAAGIWSAAERRGSALQGTRGIPPLLAWTLQFGGDTPEGLAAALRRLAGVYWFRSERAATLLTGALPAAVLVLVTGTLAIAFVVLVLGPIYHSFL